MKKVSFTFVLLSLSFSTFAENSIDQATYFCKNLKEDISNNLAVTPEWKIRTSIYRWQEHKGDMPELDISLPNFVYLQCEKDRNSTRLVNDIVFDILDQAAYAATSPLLTSYLE